MALPLLPTTMVGSYPRPAWFRYQLEGRDVLEAFKLADHLEAIGAPSLGWQLHDPVLLPEGTRAAALSIPLGESLGQGQ